MGCSVFIRSKVMIVGYSFVTNSHVVVLEIENCTCMMINKEMPWEKCGNEMVLRDKTMKLTCYEMITKRDKHKKLVTG